MRDRFDPSRLLRTEVNTLFGLMTKTSIDWSVPPADVLSEYIEASDRLLQELHVALSAAIPWGDVMTRLQRGERVNPFDSGPAMREPIFYAAESAYNFQYLDLATRRYANDADWLNAHVGFTIAQACVVAEAIDRVQSDRLDVLREQLIGTHPDEWTMLPIFCITACEVAAYTELEPTLVERILAAFTLPDGNTNPRFVELQEFNQITATPLLRLPDG